MISQRRFTCFLITLFVFDASFIDQVTTQCGYFSKPSGVNWVNNWDGTVDFNCGRGKSISRIQSLHRDCIEDRIWSFSCRSNAAAQSCSWTPTLNTYDNVLDYNCPHDGFITGIYSWHHNHYEDRRFQFRCCHSHYYRRTNCHYTHFTTMDHPFNYHVPYGYYLAGAYSVHSDYYEDRKWKFYICQKV